MLTVRVIVNVTVPVTRARACLAASVGDSDRDSGSLTRNLNHDDTVITDGLQRLQKQPATVTLYKSAFNGYKSS